MKDLITFLGKLFVAVKSALGKKTFYLLLAGILLALTACQGKVVNLNEKAETNENEIILIFDDFDASKVVDPIWETKILPYFAEKAVEINVLLEEAASDPLATTEKYAHKDRFEKYNFAVKGTGQIISVNDVKKGSLNIDLSPYDNETDVLIVIGPIISPTLNSIRGAYPDISYNDFIHSLQWRDVGNRIKYIIKETVLKDLDRENLTGKTVTFTGAFTLEKPDDYSEIIIMPIKLDVGEGE